jgi:hypothetical protein
MKQFQISPKKKKIVIKILALVVALFIIGQIAFDVRAYWEYRWNGNTTVIADLILSAVNELHKPAPIEASTGKVYFPDARLVLPPSDPFMQVIYSNVGDSKTPELQVTTKGVVSQAGVKLLIAQSSTPDSVKQINGVFDAVPNLQACARGVQIFYSPQKDNGQQFVLKATKELANHKKLYFYTETVCREDLDMLLTYLKQIQSY